MTKWTAATNTLKPEQHEMNGACTLAHRLIHSGYLDDNGQRLVAAYLDQMQKECDFKLNIKVVC